MPRYNLYPAAEVQLQSRPWLLDRVRAIAAVEGSRSERAAAAVSASSGPRSHCRRSSRATPRSVAFGLAVVFVFLLLAALYESWLLPLAVVLIVPMCILAAMVGVNARGLDREYPGRGGARRYWSGWPQRTLSSSSSLLKIRQAEGKDRVSAAIEACRIRLRPILMTSFAFILGVLPLFIAKGAGAEMLRALGTSVFSGMLGVTFFGLFLTPVFYVVIRRVALLFAARRGRPREMPRPTDEAEVASPEREPATAPEARAGGCGVRS